MKRSYKTVLLGDASVGKSSFAVRLTKGEFSDNTNSTIGAAFFTYTVHNDYSDPQKRLNINSDGKFTHTLSDGPSQSQQSSIISQSGRTSIISQSDRSTHTDRTITQSDRTITQSDRTITPDLRTNQDLRNTQSDLRTPVGSSYDENITIKFDIWDTAGQERFKSIAPIYYRGAACAIVILDISSPPTLQHAAFWVNQIRVANNNETIIVLVGNKVDLLGNTPETLQTLANAKAYAREQSISFVETSAKTGKNISYVFELLAQEISKDPFRWDKTASNSSKSSSKPLKDDANKDKINKNKCCSLL